MSISLATKKLTVLMAGTAAALMLAVAAPAAHAGSAGASFPNNAGGKAACESFVRHKAADMRASGYTVTRADCFNDQGWRGTVIWK